MKILGYFLIGMVGVAGISGMERSALAIMRIAGDIDGNGVVTQNEVEQIDRARLFYREKIADPNPTLKTQQQARSSIISEESCRPINFDVTWGVSFEGQDLALFDLDGSGKLDGFDLLQAKNIQRMNCKLNLQRINITRTLGDVDGNGTVDESDIEKVNSARILYRNIGLSPDLQNKMKRSQQVPTDFCGKITYDISWGSFVHYGQDLAIYDLNGDGEISGFDLLMVKNIYSRCKPASSNSGNTAGGGSNSGSTNGGSSSNSGDSDAACKSTVPTVTANPNGSNRIDVRWSSIPGATSYQLHWKNESGSTGMSIEVSPGATYTNTSLSNLVKNTGYVIKAKVFRCNGRIVDAPYSTPQTIRTAP